MDCLFFDVMEDVVLRHVLERGGPDGRDFFRVRSVCKAWERASHSALARREGANAFAFFSAGLGLTFPKAVRTVSGVDVPKKLLFKYAFTRRVPPPPLYKCSLCGRDKHVLMDTSCCARARKERARLMALPAQAVLVFLVIPRLIATPL